MLDPLTCACSFWSTWGRHIVYPDAKESYCINRAAKNPRSYTNSTILHNGDCKQERESLRTSQQDFYGGLFHWSTASSDFVPGGGSRNRWSTHLNGLLIYISAYVKFHREFQIPKKSLASIIRPSFLDIQVPEDVDDQTLHIIFPRLSSSQSGSLQMLLGR